MRSLLGFGFASHTKAARAYCAAQLVLDTGAVSNETLSAVLALSPQVADAVVLTVCGYLRDATRELTAAQVRHLASVCVRVDAERANTIARDAWFESCKLSSTFDWIFAARAWLLYTQLSTCLAFVTRRRNPS